MRPRLKRTKQVPPAISSAVDPTMVAGNPNTVGKWLLPSQNSVKPPAA